MREKELRRQRMVEQAMQSYRFNKGKEVAARKRAAFYAAVLKDYGVRVPEVDK